MIRLLALVALFSTAAHAQSADLEAMFADAVEEANEYGLTILEGPTYATFDGTPTPYEFDLEAETVYALAVGCLEDLGLDPEISITDPSGAPVAFEADDSNGESAVVMAAATGTYTFTVEVAGCAGECEYAMMLVKM